MSDYEVGYKKPPRHTQFGPDNCANPFGRRGRKRTSYASIALEIENSSVEYRERNQLRRTRRRSLMTKSWLAKAVAGDVGAAAMLLKVRLAGGLDDLDPVVIVMTESEWLASR